MSKNNSKRYHKKTVRIDSNHSYFDKYPTLTINRYWIPKPYLDAVHLTIQLYRDHKLSFNKAIDQAALTCPNLNRNKIAEHTLKFIANDY